MQRLQIHHRTVYSYRRPVTFGPHHWLFRPRDSHNLRIINVALDVSPFATLRWYHDVFGNSITIANLTGSSDRLAFESRLEIEYCGMENKAFPIEDTARNLPFIYPTSEQPDLARSIERQYRDPEGAIEGWARQFLNPHGNSRTLAVLSEMNEAIRTDFRYQARDEHGVRKPTDTLELGSGSCRDYAVFFMEAARSLGLAARFVTGYLYDPARDGISGIEVRGAGTTHAWAQIYLPGAGWVEFDPTNGIVGGHNLFCVGIGRTPEQAIPLRGTFDGDPEDCLGMTVEVSVRSIAGQPAAANANRS
ncbi:MAG: transglutaminase family protein [Rhodospirillales bacterium]|nr:transglutaminase family protein [Rhodospirillales bacterium]